MNFYISYFAQCRNMTSKQICFSTAIWDPKWFHDFKDQSHKFVKDGKIYGLRMTCFNAKHSGCSGMPCPYSAKSCKFLTLYNQQLRKMNFYEVLNTLIDASVTVAKELHIDEPDVVLLVHEAPDNPCSERHSIMRWFNDNGVPLKEWKKPSDL